MYHVLTSFWTQYVLAMLVKRALERNPPKTITKENLQKISSDLEVGGARQPLWWKVIRSGAAVNGSIHHVYIFMPILALFDLFVGLLREIQDGIYITTISAKCMRARHVEGHPVSPAVD